MEEGERIPHYKLKINPHDLHELQKDVWNDAPFPSKVTIDGKRLDVSLSYRGSHIREFPKKSYFLSFVQPEIYKGAKELHINAEYKDPSLIRNKLSFDFFAEIGTLSPQAHHILLSLNGKTAGIYLAIESVDAHFLKNRNLPSGSIFYAVDGDANFSLMSDLDKRVKRTLKSGYEKKLGTSRDFFRLEDFIFKINTMTREEFAKKIRKYLDVDKYLRWVAGIVFTSNYDGFVHNYALYRNGHTGLFEIIPWDYDATWGRDVNGKLMSADYVPITGYNTLTARLLDTSVFRKHYQTILLKILNHQFTEAYIIPRAEKLLHSIHPYIKEDPFKKRNLEDFEKEMAVFRKYIDERRRYIYRNISKLD